ncbi:alpha/beta fold hydrolase, partial [Escherichia coli]
ALFAHGFAWEKDSRAAVHISRGLSRAGIGVLRFDFAGTGIGGGTGEPVSFASDVEDLRAAANAMAAAGMSPALLVGHSPGGTAAIAAAADMPDNAAGGAVGGPGGPQTNLRPLGRE